MRSSDRSSRRAALPHCDGQVDDELRTTLRLIEVLLRIELVDTRWHDLRLGQKRHRIEL
jgi:hypothetical protein